MKPVVEVLLIMTSLFGEPPSPHVIKCHDFVNPPSPPRVVTSLMDAPLLNKIILRPSTIKTIMSLKTLSYNYLGIMHIYYLHTAFKIAMSEYYITKLDTNKNAYICMLDLVS